MSTGLHDGKLEHILNIDSIYRREVLRMNKMTSFLLGSIDAIAKVVDLTPHPFL